MFENIVYLVLMIGFVLMEVICLKWAWKRFHMDYAPNELIGYQISGILVLAPFILTYFIATVLFRIIMRLRGVKRFRRITKLYLKQYIGEFKEQYQIEHKLKLLNRFVS